MAKRLSFEYQLFTSENELSNVQRNLIERAKSAADLAYAPYSGFSVGAAVLLDSGDVVLASNKENASFPAGICAERNALNVVSDQFPQRIIKSIAIAANHKGFVLNDPLAPCGICRQVLCEVEQIQQSPIEIVMASESGKTLIVSKAGDLLPFAFFRDELRK